ncbi:MAG: M16 family metallopeptidase, partial [Pyrinomonadaceae bacterium]
LSDDQDTPDSYLQNLQNAVAYTGHPYANDPDGTPASMSRLGLEDVRNYHKKIMETSRLLLVIVGDLNPQDLKGKIAETLGKLPGGNYQPVQPPTLKFDTSTVGVTSRSLPTNYVNGFFVAPSLTSPDIYPMRIAGSILRDRIFDEVRAKRNLSYAPDAFLRSQGSNVGGLYVTAVDANQAVGLMLNEITRLQTEPVTPQLITSIVAQFLTNYYLGQETNSAQAGELGRFELIGGGWRKSQEFFDRLRAVTPADIERVARTYMRNIRFVVLGDPSKIDRSVFTRSTSIN